MEDKNLAIKLEELLIGQNLNYENWTLLYKGSRDGFKASDFHSRCDKKSKTLTIIKSTSGNIFGGYANQEWSSSFVYREPFQFESQPNAFLFSLVNKDNKHLIFNKSSGYISSIQCKSGYGPHFGLNDLVISDNANLNTDSYSDLGSAYTHPDYPKCTEKAQCILAGSFKFKVSEIEVYQKL